MFPKVSLSAMRDLNIGAQVPSTVHDTPPHGVLQFYEL